MVHCLDSIEVMDTEDMQVVIITDTVVIAITTTTTTTIINLIIITIMTITTTSDLLYLKQSQSLDFLALVIIIHVIITMDIIGDDRCLLPCAATDDLFMN